MFRLRLPSRVRTQIGDVLEHTAREFGQRQLEAYQTLIQQAFTSLEETPFQAAIRRELSPLGVRALSIQRLGKRASHLFLYRINEAEEAVEILAFVHERMDYQRHLPR